MPYPIRPATEADKGAIARLDGVQFGYEFQGELLDEVWTTADVERFLLATDGDRLVGVAGEYDLNFTVPGGASLDLPGITWVSVAPSHTRRGVLRSLIEAQLRRYIDEGCAGATLTASQSGIYGRFGFGAATQIRETVIEVAAARLHTPVDSTGVYIGSPEQARQVMPQIHERWRRQTPAAIHRIDARWDRVVNDFVGGKTLMYLLHDDGYIAFRPKLASSNHLTGSSATIIEYATATPHAHAALWQTLLSMELYRTIESRALPTDDPIDQLLTDPRQVRTTGR